MCVSCSALSLSNTHSCPEISCRENEFYREVTRAANRVVGYAQIGCFTVHELKLAMLAQMKSPRRPYQELANQFGVAERTLRKHVGILCARHQKSKKDVWDPLLLEQSVALYVPASAGKPTLFSRVEEAFFVGVQNYHPEFGQGLDSNMQLADLEELGRGTLKRLKVEAADKENVDPLLSSQIKRLEECKYSKRLLKGMKRRAVESELIDPIAQIKAAPLAQKRALARDPKRNAAMFETDPQAVQRRRDPSPLLEG